MWGNHGETKQQTTFHLLPLRRHLVCGEAEYGIYYQGSGIVVKTCELFVVGHCIDNHPK